MERSMKFGVLIILLFCVHLLRAQYDAPYSSKSKDLPRWVQIMYSENPNLIDLENEYEAFYKANPFVKNKYTQYYKRWIRDKWVYQDASGFYNPPNEDILSEQQKKYLELSNRKQRISNSWEELGPWEYDHDATMFLSSQSPGAAHVWTVEESISNSNIIWAGTANAGIWKSIDQGNSWSRMNAKYTFNSVYSIEIDHTNPDIVYAEGGGLLWKTIDGGLTWNSSESIQYFSWIRDIRMDPKNEQKIFVASTNGLYRSDNGGESWVLLQGGHFQEIEFHPTKPEIIYTIRSIDNHTEFWKSENGGVSFKKQLNGWPGFISSQELTNFVAQDFENSYGALGSLNLGEHDYSDFTIELRVKAYNWSGDPAIYSNKNWNNGYNKGWVIACNGNNWKFNIGDGTDRIDLNGGFINDNDWHHLAVSYSQNGDKRTYHNGELKDSSNKVLSGELVSNLLSHFAQDGTGNYSSTFNGQIAEVRVWDKSLDLNEINDWRCQSISEDHPSYSSLRHYYSFKPNEAQAIVDERGTLDGEIIGSLEKTFDNVLSCSELDFDVGEEQNRCEIAVSKASPNSIYVLATGAANGGSGLFGFYKSTDQGESFEFICCGDGPGGIPSPENPNLMGWSYDLTGAGGQYYYDLALAVSPTDSNKIFAAGISVIRSEDGGKHWETNAHWVTWVGPNTKDRYTHADVHDVKFFDNGDTVSMWIASDGGLYRSLNQGDNVEPRMHGIQGTEFWGFSSSYLHDAMVGGTYHNGTLLHYKDVYQKGKNGKGGWFAGGAGDATKGYNHPAYGNTMFEGGGMFEVINRTQGWNWQSFDNSKNANMNGQAGRFGNYEWHPNYYHTFYSPRDSILYKTENNGESWEAVYDFVTGYIYRVRIPASNPSLIYVILNDSDNVKLMKSENEGQTWLDVSPSNELTNGNNWRNKLFDIDQKDPNQIWVLLTGGGSGNKVYKSMDGGENWEDWTGSNLIEETTLDISHVQGTDGGVFVGTGNSVFYRNNQLDDWEIFNENLPIISRCGYLYPYYAEGKIRLGTYTGAYQADLYEAPLPVIKPAVDKLIGNCKTDTFYFKDLSYLNRIDAIWEWSFPGATYVSNANISDPKVVYGNSGEFDVSLKITDQFGNSDEVWIEKMVIQNPEENICESSCHLVGMDGLAEASSIEANGLEAENAFDGNLNTRWASSYSDDQYLSLDLRRLRVVCGMHINWETALGRDFNIEGSLDGEDWKLIRSIENNESFITSIDGLQDTVRYLRMQGITRGSPYGYSIWEWEIFSNPFDEDLDGDGFTANEDCDDLDPEVNSEASEIPNNDVDEDCDGIALIIDEDGDGFNSDEDCDDSDPEVNSGASEIPNNDTDENCDGEVLIIDEDGDGFNSDEDCDDADPEVNSEASEIPNNDIDEDCDGEALIIDEDGDGFNSDEDCDDSDPEVNSEASEIPNNDIDEDCDGEALIIDEDGDGFNSDEDCNDSDPEVNSEASEIPNNDIDEDCDGEALIIDEDGDGFNSDEDCDDSDPEVNSEASEIPNNDIDEDCDGEALVIDEDGDGFNSDEDCDDSDPDINSEASEIPNNDIDEDCDGEALVIDEDGDGFNSDEDCDDSNPNVNPGVSEIPNNDVDEDCDGVALIIDEDGDGFNSDEDCDDADAGINPGQAEIPNNNVDEDCDGEVLIIDEDGDGFNSDEDCDDADPEVNSEASEIPNNDIDEDCDGEALIIDEDGDGFNSDEDCNDSDPNVNPGVSEIPNNDVDEDCDGIIIVIDEDGDGYNSDDDCDDMNPDVNPDAEEIANNGIDEDCDGEDLLSSTDKSLSNAFSIYPNPANDVLYIYQNTRLDYLLTIYDISGKRLINVSNVNSIDVEDFSDGIYLLRMQDLNTKESWVQLFQILR